METNQYTRITVPLSKQEWEALRDASQQEYRHPREQARYLLRRVLFGESVPSTSLSAIQHTVANRPTPEQI